jgi:hypothetical protein
MEPLLWPLESEPGKGKPGFRPAGSFGQLRARDRHLTWIEHERRASPPASGRSLRFTGRDRARGQAYEDELPSASADDFGGMLCDNPLANASTQRPLASLPRTRQSVPGLKSEKLSNAPPLPMQYPDTPLP